MRLVAALFAASALAGAMARVSDTTMPLPFTRVMQVREPFLAGDDVFILQNLLKRLPFNVTTDGQYGNQTATAVYALKKGAYIIGWLR